MKKLIFASHNRGKYDELVDDFKAVGIKLLFPETKLDLPETSDLMSENAFMKAKRAAELTGFPALGDDSGVFIEALDFFPGVHSRRWFGDEADDSARNQKILELMKNEKNRTTYLISRFAIVDPNGNKLWSGSVKNEFTLNDKESGENGFGYDKILVPTTDMWDYMYQNNDLNCDLQEQMDNLLNSENPYITIAEMTQEQKNAITFRGRIAEDIANTCYDKL